MNELARFNPDRPTAAERVDEITKVKAVSDLLSGYEKTLRADLETDVRTLAEAAGGEFTLRAPAGKALIAVTDPKPRVSDVDAFGAWCEAVDPSLASQVDRVEVVDHEAAAQLLGMLDDQAGNRQDLRLLAEKSLTVVFEWRLADDVLEVLLARGLVVMNGETLFDTGTGEPVPGVSCSAGRETLTVTPDKKVRAGYVSELRGALGLPGGDA